MPFLHLQNAEHKFWQDGVKDQQIRHIFQRRLQDELRLGQMTLVLPNEQTDIYSHGEWYMRQVRTSDATETSDAFCDICVRTCKLTTPLGSSNQVQAVTVAFLPAGDWHRRYPCLHSIVPDKCALSELQLRVIASQRWHTCESLPTVSSNRKRTTPSEFLRQTLSILPLQGTHNADHHDDALPDNVFAVMEVLVELTALAIASALSFGSVPHPSSSNNTYSVSQFGTPTSRRNSQWDFLQRAVFRKRHKVFDGPADTFSRPSVDDNIEHHWDTDYHRWSDAGADGGDTEPDSPLDFVIRYTQTLASCSFERHKLYEHGRSRYRDSLDLWNAVGAGNLPRIRQCLDCHKEAGEEFLQQVLEHRRLMKGFSSKRIYIGSVLCYSILLSFRNTRDVGEAALQTKRVRFRKRKEMISLLLEYRADPNLQYGMYPAGAQRACLWAPLVFCPTDVEDLKMLLDSRADINATSTLNYHRNSNLVWDFCWRKNEMLLDFTLNHTELHADAVNKAAWSIDRPPLGQRLSPKMITPMELVCMRGMSQSLPRFFEKGAELTEGLLQAVFGQDQPDVVTKMAQEIAMKQPKVLLTADLLPSEHFRKPHRDILQKMYSDIASFSQGVNKLQKNVIKSFCGKGAIDPPVPQVVSLLQYAPDAAAILLDKIYLQTPHVDQANRNPLPSQCVVDENFEMNTSYEPHHTWSFDSDKFEAPAWQQKFRDAGANKGTFGSLCPKSVHTQFCDIRVLCLKGIIGYDIFEAFDDMSHLQQVKTLTECQSLRAIVNYTWTHRGSKYHMMAICSSVVQILTLLLWTLTLREDGFFVYSESAASFYWAGYSVAAVFEVLEDVFVTCGFLYFSSGTNWIERIFKVCSVSFVVGWLPLFLSIYLILAAGADPRCDSRLFCQLPMAGMQFFNWCVFLYRLKAVKTIGSVILPILEAALAPRMHGMGAVLMFGLAAFTTSCAAVMREYSFEEMFLRAYYVLVIGEPDLFDSVNYNEPAWRYAVVHGSFFLFTIVLMNVFIAITGECYRSASQHVDGSLLVERKSLCKKAVMLRMVFRRYTKPPWRPCINMLFLVAFASWVICVLSLTEGDRQRAWMMLAAWFLVISIAKMRVMWTREKLQEDFVFLDHYLWIGTPSKEAKPRTKGDLLSAIESSLEKKMKKVDLLNSKIDKLLEASCGPLPEREQSGLISPLLVPSPSYQTSLCDMDTAVPPPPLAPPPPPTPPPMPQQDCALPPPLPPPLLPPDD